MVATPTLVSHLLDALDDPAFVVRRGKVEIANADARALLGQSIEGRDLRLAVRHPQALGLILSGKRSEADIVGLGRAERPWRLLVRPIGEDRQFVRLIDSSAAHSAERMRTDFVANASHELRTPLATIIGYAETLAEDEPVKEEYRRKFGQTILTEARRMLRLVQELMALSRIEAERFRAPVGVINPCSLLQRAAENASHLARTRRSEVIVDCADGLPPVRGDEAQLDQLFDNLVSNALRYGCNERSCTVRLSAAADGSFVRFTVSDSGDGIAPQHLPRLTERFYRVDAARSRDSGGTGIGLALVKHIVERHRGTLDIASRPGAGTQVSVRLPMA